MKSFGVSDAKGPIQRNRVWQTQGKLLHKDNNWLDLEEKEQIKQ